MNGITTVKAAVIGIIGAAGAYISALFGGWNGAMTTLVIFMGIDYLTGIIVAAVFNNSDKSESGTLSSKAGYKGLIKKGGYLLIVLVAARLDMFLGSDYLKDMVVIAFVTNETLSIIENAGLMGVPIPAIFKKTIELLKSKSESEETK